LKSTLTCIVAHIDPQIKCKADQAMSELNEIASVLLVGIGATAVLDAWIAAIGRLGVPGLNFAFLGRWFGHLLRGRLVHAAIGRSAPIAGELAWGWVAHYAIGIVFAAVFISWQGIQWMQQPSAWTAVGFGICTVLIPLLVMQPAMGAGFASRRTATPLRNVIRSVANHAVFGLGLYLAALLVAELMR
jgi:hypothetical protein